MATTAWRDLALDSSGDLVIEGGDFKLLQGTDAIAQECRTALGLLTGEYPFNVELGTRWDQLLNSKTATDAQFGAEVKRVLGGVQGVLGVDNVSVQRNTVTRAATITATVTTDAGATVVVENVDIGVGV
jgi:hypothetical protein